MTRKKTVLSSCFCFAWKTGRNIAPSMKTVLFLRIAANAPDFLLTETDARSSTGAAPCFDAIEQ